MQAQTIPISINTANASAPAARGQAADNAAEAATPFREALSREIGQRQQSGDAAEEPVAQTAAAGAVPAGEAAAQTAEEAAVAAEAAAIDPVTDMLALAASLAQPAAPAITKTTVPDDASTAARGGPAAAATVAAGAHAAAQSPADPAAIAALADRANGALKTAVDVRARGDEAASPASAMFAQALAQAVQTPGTGTPVRVQEGAAQLRAMFATATQGSTPAAAGIAAEAVAEADPLAGIAQPLQPRAAVQAAQASAPAADKHQELAALAAAGGENIAEPVAAEAPAHDTSFATQLQAARTEQVPANPIAAGDRLPARVGTPAWDKQLGQKIVFMAAGAEQSASLTLNPPDLGPVQVVLNISNDQASVAFSSAQLEVRQALENAMPKLREMMGESGITLGNATVNAGMPEQQQQAQRGQDARAGGQHGNGRGNGGGADGDETAPAAVVRRVSNGVVDTFA
jgi:flagellar hook-length control protein FliK